MTQQASPLTYEGILELFRQTDLKFQEVAKESKRINRKISALGSRVGEIVENMVQGNIVEKFQQYEYVVTQHCRNMVFGSKELDTRGEVDLLLENGDVAILIEVKTTLETADVRTHIERLEKYRRHADARGDKRRFIGAVAGAVVREEAAKFAHKNGMFVIVQSGQAVDIVAPPENFVAKEW